MQKSGTGMLIILFIIFCRYVSPEYASTGMLNEGSDVYSFGILLMEIITGRSPIDYSRPSGEVNLRFLLVFIFLMISMKHYEILSLFFSPSFYVLSDELG